MLFLLSGETRWCNRPSEELTFPDPVLFTTVEAFEAAWVASLRDEDGFWGSVGGVIPVETILLWDLSDRLSDGSGFLEFDASRSEKADELGIERVCIVCCNHLLCEVKESLCRDVASGFVHEAVDLVAGGSARQSVA